MALLFVDDFTSWRPQSGGNDQSLRKWGNVTNITGSQAGFEFGLGTNITNGTMTSVDLGSTLTWIMQFALRFSGNISASTDAHIIWVESDVEQLRLQVRRKTFPNSSFLDGSQYFLDVKRGAVVLGTVGPFWSTRYNFFEIKITFDPVVGAFEIRHAVDASGTSHVDSAYVSLLSVGPVDTTDTGGANASKFQLQAFTSTNVAWDHLVVKDDTGSFNNGFYTRPALVYDQTPVTDGAQSDWTLLGGLLKDVLDDNQVTRDDDGDRIQSDTPGDISLIEPGVRGPPVIVGPFELPLNAVVHGVVLESLMAMGGGGTRNVRHVYRNLADARAFSAAHLVSGTTFILETDIFEQNPISVAAWTAQELFDSQFGYELQS